MNAEQKPLRYFEQIVLNEESTGHIIVERRYNDATIEYWSIMNLGFEQNGPRGVERGNAQVPFKIELPEHLEHPKDPFVCKDALTTARRRAAFENFDAAFKAFEPAAKQNIADQLAKQQRKQNSKILLANALPPSPRLQ